MNISEYCLTEKDTFIAAMQRLNATGVHVLFVLRDEKLVASLSEGDVRRWILSGGDLKEEISKGCHYEPFSIKKDSDVDPYAIMRSKNYGGIPVVDDDMKIIDIIFPVKVQKNRGNLNIPVVMMAGGKGTRLYPYTKILPKPLIPVGEKPIAEIIMDKFYDQGCQQFYLVVNHKKNMIKAYFNEVEKQYEIGYADEDKPLGTGGGLSLLKDQLKDTFILTNCDILIEEDFNKIYEHHKASGNKITMICSLRNFKVAYGVVDIGENGEILAMREKPEYSFFTNTGSYIVEPEVVAEMIEDEAIGFPEIIERWKEKGEKVGVYPINENAWLDMGQLDELQKMEKHLQNEM